MDHCQKKRQTERARGLGRKTREGIGKGNQMTALRFHTGVQDIRYPGPSFRGHVVHGSSTIHGQISGDGNAEIETKE